ncbi:S-layer homology domain-containing protein [Paenibacillus daejeonensis]|uniref:S-layer homology domain-containing protein n=1 Tax=Paenibacillus daejeonensis TaxID=135193 RepID=UPI001B7F89CA|nr:S-layer homology domain-containing protein [Paenibacillus daejeonensis]
MLIYLGSVPAYADHSTAFSDVPTGFWATGDIEKMAGVGILNGYEGGLFKPHHSVSREELATLLANTFYLESSSVSPTFFDVALDRWSYAAVEAAQAYLPGYVPNDGRSYFAPSAAATREEVAASIVRALGYTEDANSAVPLSPFKDAAEISPSVVEDVLLAAKLGLVQGYEDGRFRPRHSVTRAEAAAILHRALYGPIALLERKTADMPAAMLTDFAEAVGWYGTVAHTRDADRVKTGDTSLVLTTDKEHTTTGARQQQLSLDLGATRNLLLRLYVEDLEKLSKVEVRLASNPDMRAYLSYAHTRWQLVPGWNEVIIPVERFVSVGDESLERTMTTLQVSVTQRGDLPVSVVYDALYRDYEAKGKVLIQFDDGWSSVYTEAFPMMQERGFVGNVGVVSNLAGMRNYVTPEQLKEMYAQGWDMFNHTASHPRLTQLSEEQIVDELSSARAFMLRHQLGRAADFIAYPYGDYDDRVMEIASWYSRYARTTTPAFEIGQPVNPYRLKTIELVNNIDPAIYREALRTAASHGTTVMFLLHRIEAEGTSSITLHPDDFEAFLDELELFRDDVDILSISQWYETLYR